MSNVFEKMENHSRKIPCKSCDLTSPPPPPNLLLCLLNMLIEYIKVIIDTSSLFPFNHVENEIDFSSCVADMLHCNKMSLSYLSDKLFPLLNWMTKITQFLMTLSLTWTFVMLWPSMLSNAIITLSHISVNILSTKYLQQNLFFHSFI